MAAHSAGSDPLGPGLSVADLSAPVEAEVNYGNFMIEQSDNPKCASCTMHVQSLIVDSRKITSLPEFGPFPGLSWPQPIVVNTGLSGAQVRPILSIHFS